MSSSNSSFFESKKFKIFMKFVYGFGGAIVIIGAMFKITHWPGATLFLILGLSTEAVIFILSSFEPLHEEIDWSIVYPELATTDDAESEYLLDKNESESLDKSEENDIPEDHVSQKLDIMLKEANIGSELIESLGQGMKSIADQAGALKETTNVGLATSKYVENLENASSEVGKLTEEYKGASASLTGLSSDKEDSLAFGEQLTKMSENMKELNAVYEEQVKHISSQNDSYSRFNENILHILNSMETSVQNTDSYKQELEKLSQNISKLNSIYGNMLSVISDTKNS